MNGVAAHAVWRLYVGVSPAVWVKDGSPDEMRERGVRMVSEHQDEYPSQSKTIESIAKLLGENHETLRKWVRTAEVDGGKRRR